MSDRLYEKEQVENKERGSNTPPPLPMDQGVDDVKQRLKRNKIKYDPDKFVEEIDSLKSLEILDSKDIVKNIQKSIMYKILKAVEKIESSLNPTNKKLVEKWKLVERWLQWLPLPKVSPISIRC